MMYNVSTFLLILLLMGFHFSKMSTFSFHMSIMSARDWVCQTFHYEDILSSCLGCTNDSQTETKHIMVILHESHIIMFDDWKLHDYHAFIKIIEEFFFISIWYSDDFQASSWDKLKAFLVASIFTSCYCV